MILGQFLQIVCIFVNNNIITISRYFFPAPLLILTLNYQFIIENIKSFSQVKMNYLFVFHRVTVKGFVIKFTIRIIFLNILYDFFTELNSVLCVSTNNHVWSNKTNCKIDDKGKESEYNPQVHVEGVDKNVVVKVVEPTPG